MATAVNELPEGFTVDELPAGFTVDPPAPAAPPPTGRVAQLMNVPGGEQDPVRRRAWAEGQAKKEQGHKERASGVMGFLRDALGSAEATLSALSSPVGYVGGMVAGANSLAKAGIAKVAGQDQLAADFAGQVEPSREATQKALTYAPRTEEGNEILEGPLMRQVSGVMSALGPTGPVAINPGAVLGSGRNAARAVNDARRAAPSALRDVAAEVAPGAVKSTREIEAAAAKKAKLEAPENEGIANAIEAGYKLTPKAGKGGTTSRTTQTAAGSARLEQQLSSHNSEVTSRLARQDLGLADDVPLTREATEGVRKEAGDAYKAVKGVGRVELDSQLVTDLDTIAEPYLKAGDDYPQLAKNKIIDAIDGLKKADPETASIVEVVKDLRNESDKAYRSGDKKLGNDYRAAAMALDNAMDRALTKVAEKNSDPTLADAVGKYQGARRIIAKSYLLDDAMDGKPGEVNAMVYGRALNNGVRLDGPALAIGEFAKQFGGEGLAKSASKSGHTGFTFHDILLGALHPGSLAAAAMATVARPAARAVLGSEWSQRRMANRARRALPPEEPQPAAPQAPEMALVEGDLPPVAERPAQQGPLGDLTPEWETAPGASAVSSTLEVVPTEGLVPAVGEPVPRGPGPATPAVRRGAGSEIPAVPGRPDLPDTMISGAPAENAGTAATGAAMLEPNTQLAMRTQKTASNVAAAEAERAVPVPKGEATEIKPQVVEPAGSPKVKEAPVEKLPVGEATEIKPEAVKPADAPKTDARLAEVERLKSATDSEVVRKALDERAAKIKKELKAEADAAQRRDDAAELRRTAALTEDPEIKAALFEKAKEVEKVDAVPAGKTAEGQPEIKTEAPKKIPAGKTKEIEPPTNEVLADIDFPKLDEVFMEHQQREMARGEPVPDPKVVERGRRQTRAAIEKGIEDGSLGKDEGAMALWMLDQNPDLARGLRVAVGDNVKGDISRAVYKSAERIVEIFKNRESSPDRAAHEILHHSERMMPPEVQRGIRREWRAALEAEMKNSTPEVRAALENVRDGITGGTEAFEAMKKAFKDGVLDRDKHYHLTNPSEFFAVNASRILHERFTGRNAWRTQAVRWLKEMVEHVKGTVGMRSDAPVLRALSDILDQGANQGLDRSPATLKTAEGQSMTASTLTERMRAKKTETDE